ncbi:hypothetical protein ABC973_08220 [Capnocytophaga sputigena]|jgi:hypothetical protein|uniref:hypothetical protein n=1 Tax=Capnocytophaga sputigena TaxID=1019 RepID=UPI0028D68FD8|nr:hypothetical protein [Capnocytophaga sputigena]
MAREIKPTPVLEGQDVIDFYEKMANFKQSLAEKGITRESVRKNAMLLKSIFKDDRDNANK